MIRNVKNCVFMGMVALLMLGMASQDGSARFFRPTLIPNGSVNQCSNCHFNAGGGGARNPFGQSVEALVSPGSQEEFWSEALAMEDSDGDGFTNGEELQDPNGTWRPGDPAPGDSSLVSNPGDPDSVPPSTEPTSPADAYLAYLSGTKIVPNPINTDGYGFTILKVHEPEMVMEYHLYVFNLEGVTASHIHLGAADESGGVAIPLETPADGQSSGQVDITLEDLDNLKAGRFYVNVHTEQHGGGEIRGQLEDKPLQFRALLNGAQQSEDIETPASGMAMLTLSEDLTTLSYTLMVTDIENITASHIHTGKRGEDGGVSIPLADSSFEMISGEAELSEDQLMALLDEGFYINVHTTQNPPGEIRGQIELAPLSQPNAYGAYLSGANITPNPIDSEGRGVAIIRVYEKEQLLDYHLNVFGLEDVTAAHIHVGGPNENGGVAIPFNNPIEGQSFGQAHITSDQIEILKNGRFYVNVHTQEHGGGEIRGQLMDEPLAFQAMLDGQQQPEAVDTPATGDASLTLSEDLKNLSYTLTIRDIDSVTAAHIHSGPRGVNGPVSIPIADGPFEMQSDEVDINFIQLDDLLDEEFYFNVHTTQNPGGEIRGQIEFDASEFGEGTPVMDWMLH